MIRTDDHDVVQFDGPVLELMTDGRTRFDQRLAALGPDLLHDEFDEADYLRRLRGDDPTRQIGDALLDQRIVAGIGNVWKNEGCFIAGDRPVAAGARRSTTRRRWRSSAASGPLMAASAERGGRITTFDGPAARNEWRTWVHERARHAVPALPHDDPLTRPGRRQPHDVLVPGVPAMTGRSTDLPPLKRVGHKGADLVEPGNTRESFEAALEHGVDMIEFDILRAARTAGSCSRTTPRTPRSASRMTLDEGLDLFAGEAYAGVELDVDLKLPGYEREVAEALVRARARGAVDRLVDLPRVARPDRRARAGAAARLVGPPCAARLHALAARAVRLRARCS